MIHFDKAVTLVMRKCPRLPRITVPVTQAGGFVLAEPLVASFPLPRFDASAVDGYAVNAADIAGASRTSPVRLPVQDTIRAGDHRRVTLKAGHAIRILTGAAVPLKADAIVMQEHVDVKPDNVVFVRPTHPGANIRLNGEEYRRGERILEPGAVVTPPLIAMLATLGRRTVRVFRKPRVAVVVTGDELQTPGNKIVRGKIYDSNTPGLVSALHAMGVDEIETCRVGDDRKRIERVFRRVLMEADVVISSGGVSVGSSDFVKEVLATLRVRTIFWRVAIKPGKPVFFGKRGKMLMFGLPGNPVAALLGLHLFVRPALLRMMGATGIVQPVLTARLTATLRKKPGRLEFVRGVLTNKTYGNLQVEPVSGQDSHMMGGLANANCLIWFRKGAVQLRAGSKVHVSLLQWGTP